MNKKNVGIIGYGSMGKMLFEKFSAYGSSFIENVFVSNRTKEKLSAVDESKICSSNLNLAAACDVIFVCVRPADIKSVLEEIKSCINEEKILVSLNGSVSFGNIQKIIDCKIAKVIPSVTAEINKSQTLICYNPHVQPEDKTYMVKILETIGNVIELPEEEMGMGSELVSCMPGFIASIFDVISDSAKKHTKIPEQQIVNMVLNTITSTGMLMLEKNMSFKEVVERVATKGGITQEGTAVVYSNFPETADELFCKTLEKRRITAENAEKSFNS